MPDQPPSLPETINMSEARYNDLVYMILRKYFFEGNAIPGPREEDIFMCMKMGCDELFNKEAAAKGVLVAVILNEPSPRSHETMYDIQPKKVLKEVINYVEDHWIKQEIPPHVKRAMWDMYPIVIEGIMRTPEEECAVALPEGEGDVGIENKTTD